MYALSNERFGPGRPRPYAFLQNTEKRNVDDIVRQKVSLQHHLANVDVADWRGEPWGKAHLAGMIDLRPFAQIVDTGVRCAEIDADPPMFLARNDVRHLV